MGIKTISAILSAGLLLGACQPEVERGEPPAAEPVATVPAEPAPPGSADETTVDVPADSLALQRLPVGEYRVAGADGSGIDLPHGISLSVTSDVIAVASQCVTPRWTYRYEAGRLRTEPIVEPICDRGRYPAEEALEAVFDDPEEIVRTSSNGLRVTGNGRSVLLFSQ